MARLELTRIKTEKSIRMNVPMYVLIGTIATAVSESVSWCFTSRQPVRLYQGDYSSETGLGSEASGCCLRFICIARRLPVWRDYCLSLVWHGLCWPLKSWWHRGMTESDCQAATKSETVHAWHRQHPTCLPARFGPHTKRWRKVTGQSGSEVVGSKCCVVLILHIVTGIWMCASLDMPSGVVVCFCVALPAKLRALCVI